MCASLCAGLWPAVAPGAAAAQAADPRIDGPALPGPGLDEDRYLFGSDDEIEEAVLPTPRAQAPRVQAAILEAGAGLANYSAHLGAVTNGGAAWSLRGVYGAGSRFAGEIAYAGAGNDGELIRPNETAPGGLNPVNRTVYASSLDALVRLNLLGAAAAVRPFIAGGAGYFRLDSDAADLDGFESLAFPLSAGVQLYPKRPLTIGLRGTYRVLTDWIDDDFPTGDQFGGQISVGANF